MSTDAARKSRPLLRDSWLPIFGDAFGLACLLAVLVASVRGVAMMSQERYAWLLPAGFVLMALAPYVFCSREGRRRLGLRLPHRPMWLLWGLVLGAASAGLCYWLGVTLFGATDDNWFVSVRRALPVSPDMATLPTAQLFWIVAIPSMIFSPLGEEIFFRGFLQQATEERRGYRTGVIVNAGWFAVVHLLHHGIVKIDGQVQVFWLSGVIWMMLIFGVGVLFTYLRQASGSLIASILSHAAFNLGMTYTIFYGF